MNAARNRNVALEKLLELRSIILEHIIKISVMPTHEAAKHWQKEVNAYQIRLSRYHKGKGTKPNFTESLLWEYIWTDQLDELPMGFVEEYDLKKIELDVDDVKSRLKNFIDRIIQPNLLSSDLSRLKPK